MPNVVFIGDFPKVYKRDKTNDVEVACPTELLNNVTGREAEQEHD